LGLCLEAIRQNGCALEYVKNQTEELCLIAVKQNGHAIEFVDEEFKTDKLQRIADKFIKENRWTMFDTMKSMYRNIFG
jgi:hypothetical protein